MTSHTLLTLLANCYTTLGDVDNGPNTLINKFVEKLKIFFDLCELYKLVKYFMFVTHKRIKLPKEILVCSKAVNNKC
jgi:hypothetical protein